MKRLGDRGVGGGKECFCKLFLPRRAAAPSLREAADDSYMSGQLQETGLRGKGPRESD